MAFKFVALFALVATCSAGVLNNPHHQAYSDAPSVSYSSVSSPVVGHGSPSYSAPSHLAYSVAAPSHVTYSAPAPSHVAYTAQVPSHVTYSAQAPSHVTYSAQSPSHVSYSASAPSQVNYAAPAYKVAAPVAYAAPAYKIAAPVSYAAPAYKIAAPVAHAEPSAPAHYEFSYGVEDHHTGDIKSHHETREGDVTKGSYSLMEADGSKRIVEYTVDAHSGFNAVVHKEPAQGHVKSVAPVAYAKVGAPVAYAKVGAPVAYAKVAAPVAYAKVAAPLAYLAPVVAKVPALTKVTYSSAPEVSYSSVSAPVEAGHYH